MSSSLATPVAPPGHSTRIRPKPILCPDVTSKHPADSVIHYPDEVGVKLEFEIVPNPKESGVRSSMIHKTILSLTIFNPFISICI